MNLQDQSEDQMVMEVVVIDPNENIPQEDLKQIGKTWGKNILQDPTDSGIGEKIHEIIINKPSGWKKILSELCDKYNELVGFEAFGNEIN